MSLTFAVSVIDAKAPLQPNRQNTFFFQGKKQVITIAQNGAWWSFCKSVPFCFILVFFFLNEEKVHSEFRSEDYSDQKQVTKKVEAVKADTKVATTVASNLFIRLFCLIN